MVGFLSRWFKQESSSNIARNRLQVVFMHDRSDITPEMKEGLRRDIILVIQRYLEIDVEHIELDLETEKNSVALVANIPVRTVRRSSDAARKRGIND